MFTEYVNLPEGRYGISQKIHFYFSDQEAPPSMAKLHNIADQVNIQSYLSNIFATIISKNKWI